MVLHNGKTFPRVALDQFLEDKRLMEVEHVLFLEVFHVAIQQDLILIVQPHSTTWILGLLVPRLLLNLRNDALGPLHFSNSLLSLLEEALVKKKSFSKILGIALGQKIGIDAANVFVGNFLLNDFVYLRVVLLVQSCDLFGDFISLKLINLGHHPAIVLLNLL